mgnify:CR=1 FL=1
MTALESNIGNAVEVTLDAQLNSGSGNTTLDMASDPGITAPAYLVLNPDNDSKREVVKWTSGAFGSATIERDKDNKNSGNGYTHAAGDTVRQAVVKQHFEDVHDAIQQGFILEDGDGTEVEIKPAVASGAYTAREIKFVEGGGIDINWSDVTDGTDADPYDLTFTVNVSASEIATDAVTGVKLADDVISGQTDLASGLALTDELLISDAGTLKKGDVSLIADAIDGAGLDASAGTLVNAAIGKQSIWVPAAAMYPTKSNGCAAITGVETTAGKPDMYVLDFDAGTQENAQFSIAFPSYWNESTITYQIYWTSTATDTDAVIWDVSAVAVSDSDTIDATFGSIVSVTDNAISAAEDLYITTESSALTVGGSPAAGDLVYFNIARDADEGGDTLGEDARLIGIKLFYTVDDVHEA